MAKFLVDLFEGGPLDEEALLCPQVEKRLRGDEQSSRGDEKVVGAVARAA